MCALELVVSVRDHDECGQSAQAPGKEPQDVERRLVRPVRVLDGENRRGRARECSDECGRDLMWQRPRRDERGQLAADCVRYVEERPKRTRGEKRLAPTPENLPHFVLLAEAIEQRRLADSGLAMNEDERPGRIRFDARQRLA